MLEIVCLCTFGVSGLVCWMPNHPPPIFPMDFPIPEISKTQIRTGDRQIRQGPWGGVWCVCVCGGGRGHPKYKSRQPTYKSRHPKYKSRHPKFRIGILKMDSPEGAPPQENIAFGWRSFQTQYSRSQIGDKFHNSILDNMSWPSLRFNITSRPKSWPSLIFHL